MVRSKAFQIILTLGLAVSMAACSSTGSSQSPAGTSPTAMATGSGSAASPDASAPVLKVALVAPSAKNDLAFTQSMVEAVQSLQSSYNLEIAITDNAFVVDDAGNAIRQYATEGYNLIIAHGSQYGSTIQQLAPDFPNVSFAWGTAGSTFNLPNVFAYQAASNEGGYVQGAIAALISKSHKLGVIGPIAVGDAKLYVDGFVAGAKSVDESVTVNPVYTGSFSDASLMTAAAKTFVSAGADALTGSSQSVVGAIGVATQDNLPWFGTQWSQSSLAPKNEVSAQVYTWAPVLTQIITAIRSGTLGGASYTISLGNGGEVIQFNSGYALPADVKAKADEIIKGIVDGSINVPE